MIYLIHQKERELKMKDDSRFDPMLQDKKDLGRSFKLKTDNWKYLKLVALNQEMSLSKLINDILSDWIVMQDDHK